MSQGSHFMSMPGYGPLAGERVTSALQLIRPLVFENDDTDRRSPSVNPYNFSTYYRIWRFKTADMLGALYDQAYATTGTRAPLITREQFISDERTVLKERVLHVLENEMLQKHMTEKAVSQCITTLKATLTTIEAPNCSLAPKQTKPKMPRLQPLTQKQVRRQQVDALVAIINDAMLSDEKLLSKQSPDAVSFILNQMSGKPTPRDKLATRYLAWKLETEALLGDMQSPTEKILREKYIGNDDARMKDLLSKDDGMSESALDTLEKKVASYVRDAVRIVANVRSGHGGVGEPSEEAMQEVTARLAELDHCVDNKATAALVLTTRRQRHAHISQPR